MLEMIQMSIDEWLDKQNMVLCGNGMLFNNLKMNYGSDDITLSERNQTHKSVIPSTWNFHDRQIYRDRRKISDCPDLEEK